MAKLCMAHASTHGTRKPPGPKTLSEKIKKVFEKIFESYAVKKLLANGSIYFGPYIKEAESEEKHVFQMPQ